MESESIFTTIGRSIKDSFVWVLGGDPYNGKTLIDLNPENDLTDKKGSTPINWTRIIIFLVGFGFLFLLLFPIVKRFTWDKLKR